MKRLATLFTVVCFMFSIAMPSSIFAKEDDSLQKAIESVKQKIDIPESLTEFNYNAYSNDNKKIWNLDWKSKNSSDGSVSVSVDEKGTIINYYYYKNYEYSQSTKKLPKLSRQEAEKTARLFIKKVNPDILSQIKLIEPNEINTLDTTYNFNFIRTVNNVPFYSNNVSVTVNNRDGFVQSYNYNFSDDLTFTSLDDIINTQAAQKAYIDKLGLELMYEYKVENEKMSTYLVYAPKYSNGNIDAYSGEKIDLSPDYYGGYYEKEMLSKARGDSKNESNLTPEEIKAIQEVSKLISQENAEKIARDTKVLELTNEYKLTNISLNKDWIVPKNMTWTLTFSKEQENKKEYGYVNVRIDAKTGEIKSFYTSSNSNDEDAKYDKEASKSAAENFLKGFSSDKFANTVFDENTDEIVRPLINMEDKELPKHYNFRFIRKVNGIPFKANYLSVGFDAVNGKITSFESSWFDIKFVSVDKVIPIDKAYEKLFKDIELQLQYKTKYNYEIYRKLGTQNIKPEVKLVYALNPNKPAIIDAFKNIILNGDGKPYKENTTVKYTDIDYSFAKNEINILSSYGIAFEGDAFKPSENITQKDFLYFLAKAFYPYEINNQPKNKKEIDKLYDIFSREGIIKQSEKLPYSEVSREDGVKFLIRAMRLDKVADLKDIYNCPFKDKDEINSDLIGYVTIANGFKIISGHDGYFNPKNKLTREQTAVMLYNYLQR